MNYLLQTTEHAGNTGTEQTKCCRTILLIFMLLMLSFFNLNC